MALKARYTVVDGEVIAEKRSGVRHQLVPDPLGSTIALLDNTQTQTDTFTYWPYGEEQSRTGTTATPGVVGTIERKTVLRIFGLAGECLSGGE